MTTPAGSQGSVDVSVGVSGDLDTLEDGFTYVRAIEINSITPDFGPVEGGTEVSVAGRGFAEGSVLRIGALPATGLTVTNRLITALAPPGVAGAADVRVTTPDGLAGVLVDGFTYETELEVHGMSPVRGSIAGGTYVIVSGAGFVEPLAITFGDVPAEEVEILDSATLAVRTPPHPEGSVEVVVTVGEGDEPATATAPDRYLYFNPVSGSGGAFGEDILGSVNVTVITGGGTPVPGAHVQLSVRADAAFSGTTNDFGQVTLSGPDLSGAQTVTATRAGMSSGVVNAVNAENVTVILNCIPFGQCTSSEQCTSDFGGGVDNIICVCPPPYAGPFPGVCLLDQVCANEVDPLEDWGEICSGEPPPGPPFGIITGELTGVHKVTDPGPGERVMGMVVTTQSHPFSPVPVDPGAGNVLEDDGTYTLNSTLGELALVAVCGIFNDITSEFTPLYMGVRRGLFIVDGETYNIDIDCDIELDTDITVKAVNPPLFNLSNQLYLHFGSEGYFGGFPTQRGTTEELTNGPYPALVGDLAGLDYYVLGPKDGDPLADYEETAAEFPFSQVMLEGVTNIDDVVVLHEFAPIPEFTTASFSTRYIEWELPTDAEPDFYYLFIDDGQFPQPLVYWEVWLPGDYRSTNLPEYPDDASVGLFPPGDYRLIIYSVDAISFDYDRFDYNDLGLANWRSYAINGQFVANP